MIITKNLLILIFFFSTFNHAQRDSIISDIKEDTVFIIRVNPEIRPFLIHYSAFAVIYDKDNPYYGKIYYQVEIINNKNTKPVQTFHFSNSITDYPFNYDYGLSDVSIEAGMAVDINFDGYKDLRFLSGSGSNTFAVNQSYNYLIYEHKINKFVYNKDASMVTNPTPFADEKIVRGYIRNASSGTEGTIYEYKWKEDKLVLLRTINYHRINETSKFTRTIKYYKDNKVTKSETVIIDQKEIPEYHKLYW